jgi:SpoVK/Ycf46/Vps4 family AAA+-type ATPase
MDIDTSKTYNDDLPEDAIENFIENEKNGLALFYGEPGTGKSTYIRHLIQKYPKKNFIILDPNLLYNITSQSLLNQFISYKNAIYIIEDCEKLLVSRNVEQNPIMATFLNMTDGITALMINCKFICTFNTELKNIDEALKRKGRMKLEYEFKKLDKKKVQKILGSNYNEDMTIADVMYANDKITFSEKKKNKIGFQ